MTKFSIDQSTQPIPAISVRKETLEERMKRLKATADTTGRRFIHVYLEDEKKQQRNQR